MWDKLLDVLLNVTDIISVVALGVYFFNMFL